MSGVMIGVGVVAIGAGIYSSVQAGKSADEANAIAKANMEEQNRIARENLRFQREQQAKLEKQKAEYRKFEFTNPYEDIENVYEDLTVDQQQAEFQKTMFQQTQANIMEGMRGAAGSSGIAALAQTMASQGQLASQQASISIAQQERQNQMARLGEARKIDLLERQGEASVEEKEMSRQATLLGMQMQETAGAQAAVQQSQQNVMAAGAAQANLYGQQAAAQMQMAGDMFTMAGGAAMNMGVGAGGGKGKA